MAPPSGGESASSTMQALTMMHDKYDVAVVGARCAGSPCAMLLARKGYRVLLLDRDRLPSEHPMSTHGVHARGLGYLAQWGVLEQVEAIGAEPATAIRLDTGGFAVEAPLPPVDGAPGGLSKSLGPRRVALDHVLLRGAETAGVEIRDGCTVEHLLMDDGVVRGVRARSDTGTTFSVAARFVIGADGPGSRVATDAGAEKYNRVPARQGTVWSYWSGVDLANKLWIAPRDGENVYAFPTSGGLSLIGVNWAIDRFKEIGGDPGERFEQVVASALPELHAYMREGRREEKWWRGATESFFRVPCGPGWALAGDAGQKFDPCTAQGITHTFRDAAKLSDAVDAGLSGRSELAESLRAFHDDRDRWLKPFYDFTCDMARMKPLDAVQVSMMELGLTDPGIVTRFAGLITTATQPKSFFSPRNMVPLVARMGRHKLRKLIRRSGER